MNRIIMPVFSPILVNQPVLANLQNLGQVIQRQANYGGQKPDSVQVGIFDPTTNTVRIFEADGRDLSHRLRAELRGAFDDLADSTQVKIGTDHELGGYLKSQMPLVVIDIPQTEPGRVVPRSDWSRVKHEAREQIKSFFQVTFETADKCDQRLACSQKLATTDGQTALDRTSDKAIDRFFASVTTVREVKLTEITRQKTASTTTEATLMGALVQELRLRNVMPLTTDPTYATTPDQRERELTTTGSRTGNPRN